MLIFIEQPTGGNSDYGFLFPPKQRLHKFYEFLKF